MADARCVFHALDSYFDSSWRRLTVIRSLSFAVAVALIGLPPGPALAQDDLARQLINACVGCRFPKDLHGRDLHGLHFVGADLRGADFTHANLNGAVFTGCDLENARFDDADLRNARFVGVSFAGTSFARAKLDGISLRGVDFGPRGPGSLSSRLPSQLPEIYEYPTSLSPELERRLRYLAEHPPAMPPMPPMPRIELPPLPPMPAAPPAPAAPQTPVATPRR
jgi:hypothetical protein